MVRSAASWMSVIYALWLCGSSGKRSRGYSGNFDNLRIAEEQHLRTCFLDTCDAEVTSLVDQQRSLKDLMVTKHLPLAEHIVGLAFVRFSTSYASRLDGLSHEQRTVILGLIAFFLFARVNGQVIISRRCFREFRFRLALHSQTFGTIGMGFAEILQFIRLPNPEFAVHRGGAERATTEGFRLTAACVDRMLQQQMRDGNAVHVRVREVAQRLLQEGVQQQDHLGNVLLSEGLGPAGLGHIFDTALQTPVGICYLVMNSVWHTLAIAPSGKWDPDCDASPLLSEVRRAANACELKGEDLQTFLPASSLQPTHQFFSLLADDLCEWGRAIIAASSTQEDTRESLEQYVIWLNSMREATAKKRVMDHAWEASTKGRLGRFNPVTESHGRYRAIFLIQCVMLSFHLKSSSTVGLALQRAFAVLPDIWQKTLSACFSVECVPSGATISRARLYLDAAFMHYMREKHERLIDEEAVFFALTDSSPQGLQNWLMTETFGVGGQDLMHAAEVFFDLCLLSKRQSEMGGNEDRLNVEDLESVLERTEQIRRAFMHHTFPPTGLGVRHTTLSHKVHAYLHSLRLEHSTWELLQKFLKRTFTYTSDMGTEGSFNLTRVDVPSYFGYWPDQSSNSHLALEFQDADIDQPAEEDDGAGVGPLQEAASPECHSLDLSSSLWVPGMFHIIDNATKDVLRKSDVWCSDVKGMLESVLLFFNAFHRRKWFIAKCCVRQFQAWSVFFEAAAPKLEGGRAWGVVSEGMSWVLERKLMLQQAWSADALLQAGAPEAEGGDGADPGESTKLVARVDEALSSPVFWAYLGIGSCIIDILDRITSWTQGCACHGSEVRAQLKPLLRGLGPLSCPMRGRRAPEIAEGALHRFIDGLFQFNDSQVMLVHVAGLQQDLKTRLMLDWSAMKVHLRMQFDLKLSSWKQLPLSALALGHFDVSVAQRLMWNCLVQWENLSEEQQSNAHSHTKVLFVDRRQEVLSFVRGEDRTNWPRIARTRACCAFVPVLEQSIERRHAILHQHLKSAPAPFGSLRFFMRTQR